MKNNKILICGTGASGSSAIFEYLNCFNSIYGIERELKPEIRTNIYLKWAKRKYKYTDYYKYKLSKFLKSIYSDNKTLMLNNTLSCLQLSGIELFDNIKVCCVLRDPRSTWVAWQNEWVDKKGNKKWASSKDSVGDFIISYKKCMLKFLKEYSMIKNKSNILIINFEDFVLDLEYEKKVINFFNLDDRDIYRNPKSALRNINRTIFAHHNYSKDIISRIEYELKEYCHKLV